MSSASSPDGSWPDGNWIITEAEGLEVGGGQMRFEISNGAVFGQAPCNSFTARLITTDGQFSLGPLDVRGKVCGEDVMALERAYLRILQRLSHFEIDAEGALVLSSFGMPVIRAVPAR